MNNYIDPFLIRSFSERFCCVFAFAKQNFVQVLRLNLLPLIVMAALYSYLTTSLPNFKSSMGDCICFICFAYFSYYITNCGDMQKTSFKDMLNSIGHAFGKVLEASLIMVAFSIAFVVVLILYAVIWGLIIDDLSHNIPALIIFVIPIIAFFSYVYPIIHIYYIHFYFSSKFKSSFEALKESFRLVKGHWWNTFGFIIMFELLATIIAILILLLSPSESTFIATWIRNIILAVITFYSTNVVALYQYGHLKALKEEK